MEFYVFLFFFFGVPPLKKMQLDVGNEPYRPVKAIIPYPFALKNINMQILVSTGCIVMVLELPPLKINDREKKQAEASGSCLQSRVCEVR